MSRNKAEKLFRGVNTFFISCIGSDGYPLTKAVLPVKRYRKSLDEIYFCTNTSSKFAEAVSKNPKANVYFYTRKLIWKGCMLKGNMEIVTDVATKEKCWENKYKNAYPGKSPACPDFCVLRFTPTSGRFYRWFKIDDFCFVSGV